MSAFVYISYHVQNGLIKPEAGSTLSDTPGIVAHRYQFRKVWWPHFMIESFMKIIG